jgi:hypothetical protein
MAYSEKYIDGKAARQDAEDALKEFAEIDGKVDSRFEDYIKSAIALCKVVEGGIEDGEDEFIKELKSKLEVMQNIRQKLSEDPALREEIMG